MQPSKKTSHIIRAGDIYQFEKEIFEEEVRQFAEFTGDYNPLHMEEAFAEKLSHKKRIVHGMLVASLSSRLVGMELSCPGALWVEQNLRFVSPVFIGDRLNFSVEILQISQGTQSAKIRIFIRKENKQTVLTGEGTILLSYGKK